MKRDLSFGAVVFRQHCGKREYLLVHHASGQHWDHPKGHPERGESPWETAKREVEEESGVLVSLRSGMRLEASWTLPSGQPKTVTYYLGEATGEGVTGGPEGEILNCQWCSFSQAMERITWESGKEVLKAAEEILNGE